MRNKLKATTAAVGVLAMSVGSAANAQVGGGGELIIAAIQEVQTLEAQNAYKEVNAIGLRNILEQLTTLDPDTGEVVPMLATSWEQVEPTRWRFSLREGVSFHDGSPFNAESAAAGMNYIWDPANSFNILEMRGPQLTAVAASEYELDLVTEAPDPLMPVRMTVASLASAKQLAEAPERHVDTPIGTGPYRFVEWARGQYYLAEKNEDWWGIVADDAYGEIHFDSVRVAFVPETSVRASLVENGEAHLAMFLTVDDCNRFETAPALKCIVEPSDTYLQLRLDYTGGHPTLEDLRFREAFFKAIDTEGIREFIMVHGSPLRGQMLPSIATGYHDGLDTYGYDPERSMELLAELRAEGIEIPSVHIATRIGSTPRNGEMVEAINAMLNEVGIENTVAVEEPAVFNVRATTKPADNRAYMWVHVRGNPLMDYAATFTSDYTCVSIVSVWCDPEFDSQLAAAAALSGSERHEALRDLNAYTHERFVMDSIGLLARAYGVPADFDWNFAIDHRLMAVQMRRAN